MVDDLNANVVFAPGQAGLDVKVEHRQVGQRSGGARAALTPDLG